MLFLTSAVLCSLAVLSTALPHQKRQLPTQGSMLLCKDFDGSGDDCANVGIPPDAFDSTFQVDPGTLCTLLGACPSAMTILTPNVHCTLGSQVVNEFLTGAQCGGTTLEIDSNSGQLNFPDGLNDNLGCMSCAGVFLPPAALPNTQ